MTAAADPLISLSHYYLPVYKPRQLVLERGQGARVWDSQGREFIDLAAGIAVCGLGHNDPDLKAALLEQADKLWHTSNVFYSAPPLHLAEELVQASRFAERVFLCNSGAEANEVAIKLVRKWASSQGRSADRRVITGAPWARSPRPPSPSTRKATNPCRKASATLTSTTRCSWRPPWPPAMWPP